MTFICWSCHHQETNYSGDLGHCVLCMATSMGCLEEPVGVEVVLMRDQEGALHVLYSDMNYLWDNRDAQQYGLSWEIGWSWRPIH